MKSLMMIAMAVISLIILSSCVEKKSYIVDKNLLDNEHIFRSSQEASFSMKIPESLIYQGPVDFSKNDTDGSWTTKIYKFVNEQQSYIIMIEMTTIAIAEWGAGYPWTKELGKEMHGSKPFHCGTGVLPKNANTTGKNVKVTFKGWMYIPGGIGTSGATRIIVYYMEKGDHTNGLNSFLARADNRVDFTMSSSYVNSKRYITIKEPDVVWEYGISKYEVSPNDTLEILLIKTCRGGTGICWKVKNIKTGELGYVSSERMHQRHEVYTK